MSRAVYWAVIVAALALAFWLRAGELSLRPMHTDEAVHAEKFRQLWLEGTYRYDPEEYHGPTLYYATLPIVWLTGMKDFASTTEAMYRTVPLIFTLGLIALLPLVADGLGRRATAWAALLTAVSPAFVFYGRYYIQEPLFVFFTFAAIACGWRFFRSRGVIWAILTGIAVGLVHATKETAIIQLGCIAASLVLTWRLSRRIVRPPSVASAAVELPAVVDFPLRAFSRSPVRTWTGVLLGVVFAVLTSVAFYSSFFTYGQGPADSILTYLTYFDRAGNHGLHNQPWYFYLHRLLYVRWSPGPAWSEAAIVIGALFGIIAAIFADRHTRRARANGRPASGGPTSGGPTGGGPTGGGPTGGGPTGGGPVSDRSFPGAASPVADPIIPRVEPRLEKDRSATGPPLHCTPHTGLMVFLTLYTVLLTAAYTVISYKTTWCMLGFLHGMILLAGVGIAAILRAARDRDERTVVVLVGLAAAAHLAWQADRANSPKFCASNYNPYVYAHPVNDLLNLPRWLEKLAAVDPAGRDLLIKVYTPDAWPVPWYLRHFRNVGYWEHPPAVAGGEAAGDALSSADAPVVIVWPELVAEFEAASRDEYRPSLIGLRPGVVLSVYTRRSLYDAFVARETGAIRP
ncbi:MAG: TIGR03663 family protein [Phycisphaerales bacterium]|nr:TIGR03663 family protein [Phycisphaerales bacterium]